MGPPDTSNCTIATCPIALSRLGYIPKVGGNAFLAAWFGLLLLIQLGFSVRYKTWSYLFGQFCGLILEIIGYAARIKLYDNPFDNGQFITYIVTTTIAPAFLCFTIYLCFGRIVIVYGTKLSRISFRAYTIIFVTMDVICLLLQAGGAAWTQANNITPENLKRALNVLRAGLGMQIASLAVFIVLSLDLTYRVIRHQNDWNPQYAPLRSKKMFTSFLIGLFSAAILILIRSAYRVEELNDGPSAAPKKDAQTLYMIFEGAVIGLATLLLAIFHPGPIFESEWRSTGFFSKHKQEEVPGFELRAVERL